MRDGDSTPTADDFKGEVVLLYFGYTFCPDICPLILANVDLVLKARGNTARDVRVLFVTVDPDRDTASRAFTSRTACIRGLHLLDGSDGSII